MRQLRLADITTTDAQRSAPKSSPTVHDRWNGLKWAEICNCEQENQSFPGEKAVSPLFTTEESGKQYEQSNKWTSLPTTLTLPMIIICIPGTANSWWHHVSQRILAGHKSSAPSQQGWWHHLAKYRHWLPATQRTGIFNQSISSACSKMGTKVNLLLVMVIVAHVFLH